MLCSLYSFELVPCPLLICTTILRLSLCQSLKNKDYHSASKRIQDVFDAAIRTQQPIKCVLFFAYFLFVRQLYWVNGEVVARGRPRHLNGALRCISSSARKTRGVAQRDGSGRPARASNWSSS